MPLGGAAKINMNEQKHKEPKMWRFLRENNLEKSNTY